MATDFGAISAYVRRIGMMTCRRRCRLFGEDYLYIGAPDLSDGAIATREQYENWEVSFAFLRDGIIVRFDEQIGVASDIEWGEDDRTI